MKPSGHLKRRNGAINVARRRKGKREQMQGFCIPRMGRGFRLGDRKGALGIAALEEFSGLP
jgi:hypothetical protein